jgi:Cu/Ag efflux protein CusF
MRSAFSVFAVLALFLPTAVLAQAPGKPGTTGAVNVVDAAKHTVNLTHGPIATLGWPAMTMDFGTAPSVDLSGVKPGDVVAFTVLKTPDGGYLIDTLKPAK